MSRMSDISRTRLTLFYLLGSLEFIYGKALRIFDKIPSMSYLWSIDYGCTNSVIQKAINDRKLRKSRNNHLAEAYMSS